MQPDCSFHPTFQRDPEFHQSNLTFKICTKTEVMNIEESIGYLGKINVISVSLFSHRFFPNRIGLKFKR